MAPFNAVDKAPGVYIDEVQVAGPIAGVGTSVAAFIGPALAGPINKPTLLTNWTEFTKQFGLEGNEGQFEPYITSPRVYVTHAVRGFFENGGTTCYFVRVGSGKRASRPLLDRGTKAQPTLVVTAKKEGVAGNNITVEVQESSLSDEGLVAQQESAVLSKVKDNQAFLKLESDAEKFYPGDSVSLSQADKTERAIISSRSIRGKTITFQHNLQQVKGDSTEAEPIVMRIADLAANSQTSIRISNTDGVYPGSNITITQTDGDNEQTEYAVVQRIERTNKFIILMKPLAQTYKMDSKDSLVKIQTNEFNLIVTDPSGKEERFEKLSMDSRHERFFGKSTVLTSEFVEVTLADPPSSNLPPNNLPCILARSMIGIEGITKGVNDDVTKALDPDNADSYEKALKELERIDSVNILCIPDRTDRSVQKAMISHCERMKDRFAILDPRETATQDPTPTNLNGIGAQRNDVSSDSGYAALYYPWLYISDPLGTGKLKVPPSGHIAGIYARSDSTRGVFKAPANEQIQGALEPALFLTDGEQGPLNEIGVNVLRQLPGRGPVVWGARTTAPKDRTQWRYVNVRRLLLYIEESIQEGTQFAVFEPNNLELRQKVKRQVTDFLTRVWQDGALFGATPDQAFQVRVDEELNPPSLRSLGQLVFEVRLYPVPPAEFIVFRIIQTPGGPTVQE